MESWFGREGEEREDIFTEDSVESIERKDSFVDESTSFSGGFGVGEISYSPAVSVLYATCFEAENDVLQVGDRRLTWWEDFSVVPKHDFMLVNPLTWSQQATVPEDLTEGVLGADLSDQFVFADSGGFQVKTFEGTCVVDSPDLHDFEKMQVMPEKLLEWQVKNATAGAILDFPPYRVDANSGGTEGIDGMNMESWGREVFTPNLQQSTENARRAAAHREKIGADDFLLYNVLHGMIPFGEEEPYRYVKEWYSQISEVGDFDGWCVGVDSGNIGKLALFLGFIDEHIDDASHLHFLGTSAIPARVVLEYWRNFSKDDFAITLDSTGFEVGSQYRSFFNPLLHGEGVMVSDREPNDPDKFSISEGSVPCSCAVCGHMSRVRGPDWPFKEKTATEGVAMNLHNLNMLLQRHRMVEGMFQSAGSGVVDDFERDSSTVWKILGRLFSDESLVELYECMKFLRRVDNDGFYSAVDDFRFFSKYDPDRSGTLVSEKTVGGFSDW